MAAELVSALSDEYAVVENPPYIPPRYSCTRVRGVSAI
jgi:hypothetical protein